MQQPTPAEIIAARHEAGDTQTQAANRVHVKLRTWQQWEAAAELKTSRKMPLAAWELYIIKTTNLVPTNENSKK